MLCPQFGVAGLHIELVALSFCIHSLPLSCHGTLSPETEIGHHKSHNNIVAAFEDDDLSLMAMIMPPWMTLKPLH
jgi:hypothetical protein